MPDFSPETADFISELDAAVEAHMDWSRRVLRCAVLRTAPGEDVLAPLAHTLCGFGRWFGSNRKLFQKLDAPNTRRLDAVHQAMHDAIRSICADVLAGRPGQGPDLESFERMQCELISLLAEFKTHFLASAARHDPLTGLPLRYGIEDEFTQVQKNCRRHKTQLYVGIIDADHFKRVNDSYGHSTGDIALCHLADTLRRIVRPNEPLFRFGGEEFLLLMQCRNREAAATAAQRIVQTVRRAQVPLAQGDSLVLTITLGLARAGEDEAMADAVERADKALYAGKEAGRDRYVIADEVATA
ncbi:MAG: diguanylate cyclase [Rhodocyclales bacterium]|nr:diguanylate cyclase [Rhodocyclales bacterium]